MNTKLLTSMGCLLLLAATMTPAVLGHDDNGDDRNFGPGTTTVNGVSGRYVNSAGPALTNSGDEIVIIENETDPENPILSIPSGVLIVGGLMSCDHEVAGPGLIILPADEVDVDREHASDADSDDGWFANAQTGEGPVPGNETLVYTSGWDDGGHGGACHTNSYTVENYNTPGCPGEFAYANDDISGDVFIGASCDWQAQGEEDFDAGFLVCLINVGQAGWPLDCLTQFAEVVLCLIGSPECSSGGSGGDICGADGSADGSNYGSGNAGVPYPAAPNAAEFGETYGNGANDDDGDNCPSSDATASVFTFDQIDLATGDVSLALAGDIWQETQGGGLPVFGPCRDANAGELVVEQRACRHPVTGDLCLVWVSVWVPNVSPPPQRQCH